MSASDTLYKAMQLGKRKKGNGREAAPPSGVKLRGIIVGGLTDLAEQGEGLKVAEKLAELLDCGKPAIELRACEVIEKFTRDIDTGDNDEQEVVKRDFTGKQPYTPDAAEDAEAHADN
jgi:hypothetical protein